MNRIRTLRLANGLTQDQLVHAIGGRITKQALSKYERGTAQPSPVVARALASALRVRAIDLFAAPRFRIDFLAYRSNAGLGVRAREGLQALLAERLSRRLDLQGRLGISPRFDMTRTFVTAYEDAEDAADELRVDWSLGTDPVANLTDTLERRQVHVLEVVDAPDKFHGISAIARGETDSVLGAAVAYRDGASGDRQRLTMAHEVGHLCMEVAEDLDEEKAAFRFAGALLMPAKAMFESLGRRRRGGIGLGELVLLKRHFGVSMQAIVVRASDLDIIDSGVKRQLFIEFSKRGWRKAEPEPIPVEKSALWPQLIARARAEGVLGKQEEERLIEPAEGLAERLSTKVEGDPRAVLSLPARERGHLLEAQAKEARRAYEEDESLTEWLHDYEEDEAIEPS